uniref:Uncharacterized protein n=1 Tax=Photinus pyralis TaxID=7054 RepID=A0A1Y1ME61_PHOPY
MIQMRYWTYQQEEQRPYHTGCQDSVCLGMEGTPTLPHMEHHHKPNGKRSRGLPWEDGKRIAETNIKGRKKAVEYWRWRKNQPQGQVAKGRRKWGQKVMRGEDNNKKSLTRGKTGKGTRPKDRNIGSQ